MLPNADYENIYTAKYDISGVSAFARVLPRDIARDALIDPKRLLTYAGTSPVAAQKVTVTNPTIANNVVVKNFPRTQRVTERQRYGSFQTLNFGGTLTDQLVLASPTTDRIFLAIQNLSLAGNLFIAFGSAANTTNGFKLFPGGALLLDAVVSQDDIHIISDIAGPTLGVILYANKGIDE